MPATSRVMYVAFGVLALLASALVLIRPSIVVPPGAPGSVQHLCQEQAAAFVFVGLMCLFAVTFPAHHRSLPPVTA